MTSPPSTDRLRRPGYAPTHPVVGRRGRHTRDRILKSAAELFAAKGFHGTSVDDIARAVGRSRAVVYQYFASTDSIFLELAHECERVVLDHGRQLTGLGADADGMDCLRSWLHEWEGLYDRYATVFLEFPGIGPVSGRPQADAGIVSEHYTNLIADRLRESGITGIEPADAAAAMLRIAHMTNLYRYRNMFNLPTGHTFSDSLAIAIQLLLFPNTPPEVVAAVIPVAPKVGKPTRWNDFGDPPPAPPVDEPSVTRRDILRASAALFTERGYYAVGMPDILAAADISRATLYRYFSTKMEILSELTGLAVSEGTTLARQLDELAQHGPTASGLNGWLRQYVSFHRRYGGVVRAWYDGTLGEQLAEGVTRGTVPFQRAASNLLERISFPARMDRAVAAAVFLAVLGRMADVAVAPSGGMTDQEAAEFMMAILCRSLFIEWK